MAWLSMIIRQKKMLLRSIFSWLFKLAWISHCKNSRMIRPFLQWDYEVWLSLGWYGKNGCPMKDAWIQNQPHLTVKSRMRLVVYYVKVLLSYGMRYVKRHSVFARLVNMYFVRCWCDSQVLQSGIVKFFAKVREHGADESDAQFHTVRLTLAESQPCCDVP